MKKLRIVSVALIIVALIYFFNNQHMHDYTVAALSLISICIFGLAKVGCEE